MNDEACLYCTFSCLDRHGCSYFVTAVFVDGFDVLVESEHGEDWFFARPFGIDVNNWLEIRFHERDRRGRTMEEYKHELMEAFGRVWKDRVVEVDIINGRYLVPKLLLKIQNTAKYYGFDRLPSTGQWYLTSRGENLEAREKFPFRAAPLPTRRSDAATLADQQKALANALMSIADAIRSLSSTPSPGRPSNG